MQTNSPHLSDGLGIRFFRDADNFFIETLYNAIRDVFRFISDGSDLVKTSRRDRPKILIFMALPGFWFHI